MEIMERGPADLETKHRRAGARSDEAKERLFLILGQGGHRLPEDLDGHLVLVVCHVCRQERPFNLAFFKIA